MDLVELMPDTPDAVTASLNSVLDDHHDPPAMPKASAPLPPSTEHPAVPHYAPQYHYAQPMAQPMMYMPAVPAVRGAEYVMPVAPVTPHGAGPVGQGHPIQPFAPGRGGRDKSAKTASLPFEQLTGRAVQAARDQTGCRSLQRILEEEPWGSAEVQSLLAELQPALPDLIADQYGNFLIQKLVEVATPEYRSFMITAIAPHLPVVAATPHGTFAAQRLIEALRTKEDFEALAAGILRDIVRLCNDQHGAHVITKCLTALPVEERGFVFTGVAAHLVAIANTKVGCCVVQRCVEKSLHTPDQLAIIVGAIVDHILLLASDQYGNYVAQCVVDKTPARCPAINDIALRLGDTAERLQAHATHQSVSKLLEKILARCSVSPQAATILSVMAAPPVAAALMADQYGNYVVQAGVALAARVFEDSGRCGLDAAGQAAVSHFLKSIAAAVPQIRGTVYGRKLEAKLEQALAHRNAAMADTPPIVAAPGGPAPPPATPPYAATPHAMPHMMAAPMPPMVPAGYAPCPVPGYGMVQMVPAMVPVYHSPASSGYTDAQGLSSGGSVATQPTLFHPQYYSDAPV